MRRPIAVIAILPTFALLLVVDPPARAATDWPMWLENPSHSPTADLKPAGVFQEAWRVKCGGIFGSAVVHDGTVYFASRDGFLYAVDDETGQTLWNAQLVPPGTELRERVAGRLEWWQRCETGLLATPAVDGERVYIGGLDGVFHARSRETGDPAWGQELAAAIVSSPVLTPKLVVVGTRGGGLFALDRVTGEPQWLYEAGGPINSSPASADDKIVVGTAVGVVAVDAATGEAAWEARYPDKFDASPCIVDGRVYIGNWAGEVVALDLNTGEVVWEQQVADRPIFASAAVAHDLVFAATTGAKIAALDVDTGAPLWETFVQGGATYASPLVCGTVVLVGTNSGHLSLIDIPSGRPLIDLRTSAWRYIHGTPTVTDRAIYVASEAIAGPVVGSVQKMVFGPYTPRAEHLRAREVAAVVCLDLKLFEERERRRSEGWDRIYRPSTIESDARTKLRQLGVITQPWHWESTINRYQLAALFDKLLWDPNPLSVRLPAYTEALLADAAQFPRWGYETPPKVVGLGLMQAIDGEFRGSDPVTLPDLRASLERAQELVGGP